MSALPESVLAGLRQVLGGKVRFDEPLGRLTSMGIGGPADAYCLAGDLARLKAVLDVLALHHVRWLILGRGSNLLPADSGFRGAVIRLEGEFNQVEVQGTSVEAGAAVWLATLVERAMAKDLGGLEFTTGIPGCVGGSLIGNAGTATEAIGDLVERVDVLVPGGAVRALAKQDLAFSYRTSVLKGMGAVVLRARFALEPRPRALVAERLKAYALKRRGQPHAMPNVGCIFRNPPGDSAGRLIDAAGLKGERVGRIEVSRVHANFMVNVGGGTAADVRGLILRVRERVRAASGVTLQPEVVLLDETGRPAALEAGAAC